MKRDCQGYQYLLMLGHLCTDITQGALPAIIPFLIVTWNMSYASAASLLFASSIVSSVVQPLFGYLGDKAHRPWLMSLGVALAGSGIALIGIFQSYWAVCAAAAVSGFGVALFHPEGGKTANFVAGEKKGTGISVFAVGGNLGFALGPIIASAALVAWGLKGTVIFLLPTYLMAGIILFFTPRLKKMIPAADEKKEIQSDNVQPDDWNSFARISSVTICRAIVQSSLMVFIPLYWINIFFMPEAVANTRLTIFSLAGAVATLLGGRFADKYGFRRTIYISFLALAPMIFILLQMSNSFAATLLIIPIAFAISGPFSIMIATGQSFLPNHIGFASGISLGLAVSIGGLCAPIIGWIGDTFGLMTAMYTITGVALVALLLTLILPKQKEQSINT